MKTGPPVVATPPNDRVVDSSQSTAERTPWLLGFLCLLIPVLPSSLVPVGPLRSNGSPAKLIAVLSFGLVILGFLLIRRTARMRTVRPGVVPILLYFLLELTIYGVGLTHLGSALLEANKTRWIIIVLANTGVALYVMTRVETVRQRTILLACLAVGLTFACVVGLLQSIAIDLRFFIQPPGFVFNTEFEEFGNRFGATRVVGTSQHAIEFSILAAITVPLTIHFTRFAARWPLRLLAFVGCLIALMAMPAGVSRSGVVALAAALLVYMWSFNLRAIVTGVTAAAVAITAYVLAFPSTATALQETILQSESDPSVLTRTADYAVVSETFRAHPLFGLGLGGAPPTEYGFLDNEWLQAIVQGGILGVTAMIVLTAGALFGISAALRGATSPRERDQAYVTGAMMVGILANSFTFDLFTYQQTTLLFFIFFGLVWSNFTFPMPDARQPLIAHVPSSPLRAR